MNLYARQFSIVMEGKDNRFIHNVENVKVITLSNSGYSALSKKYFRLGTIRDQLKNLIL